MILFELDGVDEEAGTVVAAPPEEEALEGADDDVCCCFYHYCSFPLLNLILFLELDQNKNLLEGDSLLFH